jgi:peptidyl-tRNA hydrolase, PTH1 family
MTGRPVNYVIVGLGNIGPEYKETRHNAGYIFIDYLSNALELANGSTAAPIFQRLPHLQADVLDTTLTVSNQNVTNSLRVLLVKPLTMMNDAGSAVKKVLQQYGITGAETKQRLIVIADDLNTLPGCLSIQIGGTLKSLTGHKGIESICRELETTDYVRYVCGSFHFHSWSYFTVADIEPTRFRLGIGRPIQGTTIPDWVLSNFTKEKNEMVIYVPMSPLW